MLKRKYTFGWSITARAEERKKERKKSQSSRYSPWAAPRHMVDPPAHWALLIFIRASRCSFLFSRSLSFPLSLSLPLSLYLFPSHFIFSILTSLRGLYFRRQSACIPGSCRLLAGGRSERERERERGGKKEESVWREAHTTNESDAVASAKHGCAFSPLSSSSFFFSKEGRSFCALQ